MEGKDEVQRKLLYRRPLGSLCVLRLDRPRPSKEVCGGGIL